MSMGRPATGPDGLPALPPPRRNSSQMVFSNGRMRMVTTDSTMQEIATMLTGQVGRPVTDSTGLTGKYDYTLTFASETMGGGGGAALVAASDSGPLLDPDGDNGPTIFSAIQEQLGLKLEQKKGTVDMFVIDHVEKMPTEN
jgi:uncharacterized protein (TIGR03435 family)